MMKVYFRLLARFCKFVIKSLKLGSGLVFKEKVNIWSGIFSETNFLISCEDSIIKLYIFVKYFTVSIENSCEEFINVLFKNFKTGVTFSTEEQILFRPVGFWIIFKRTYAPAVWTNPQE